MPSRRASAGNCALYARAQTGVFLFGAAGGWWDEALAAISAAKSRRWARSWSSGERAVFPRATSRSSPRSINAREIVVDHANWYHGMVTRDVTVIDNSPNNDWSAVAVMDLGTGKYGRD